MGPILLLCYRNDLPGTTFYFTHFFLQATQNLPELKNYVNTEFNKMAIWFRAQTKWLLMPKKQNTLYFMQKIKKGIQATVTVLVFNNNEPYKNDFVTPLCRIQNNHPITDLIGIWLDENLSYDDHVKKTVE